MVTLHTHTSMRRILQVWSEMQKNVTPFVSLGPIDAGKQVMDNVEVVSSAKFL